MTVVTPNTIPGYKIDVTAKHVMLNPYSSDMETQYANNYHIQNEMLHNFKDKQSTNETKVNTIKVQTYNLNWYNLILAYIYIGFTFIFIVFCFVGKKMSNWSIYAKIIVVIIFILFPFVITLIEQVAMKIFSYILNFMNGTAYISPSF
jgi:hypothetical protein